MQPTTNESTTRWSFDHHRLDAFAISKDAMVMGMRISADLPKGYGKLKDQLERALQGAFTQTTEAAARSGQDRRSRFRIARAEAGEAAGILEGLIALGVTHPDRADPVLELLWRLSGILYRLANPRR
jgi:four helix bundle protein